MRQGGPLNPGSYARAAEIARSALLEAGATNLQAKLGGHVASFGDTCFQSDATVREALKRWDGRRYHRESIGRARRQMKKRGWLGSDRVFPQQLPKGAKYPSTYGTTNKSLHWKALGLRNPLTKGERKEKRKQARRADAPSDFTPRRRHAHNVIDPRFAAMLQDVGAKSSSGDKIITGRSERPADRGRARQQDAEASAADQRERFAQWVRDNEKKPP